jgi:thiamine biosynthesis lipoprotein
VGPLVRLWGFGPQSQGDFLAGGEKPDPEQIHSLLSLVGCQHLRVRSEPPALQKTVEGVEVDLSSLAKGYAVDRIIELLRQREAGGAMAEIGGEVRTLGTREDGADWRIGIENPSPEDRDTFRVVHLRDAALATSGDYRNFHSFEGVQFCHIIDPRTGHPLPARRASVTVCAATCMEADALATALFLIGAEQGREWCEEHDVAAMFLTLKDGKVVETHTSQFDQYLQ